MKYMNRRSQGNFESYSRSFCPNSRATIVITMLTLASLWPDSLYERGKS